jgi:HEAT repeat protein
MNNIYLRILFIVIGVLACNAYATSEDSLESGNPSQEAEMQAFQKALEAPKTFHTDIRSGQVVDANTGNPIEGVVLLYIWNINEFSLFDSGSRQAGFYETITDKEGKYFVPDQAIESQTGAVARLEPEEVFAYKYGYVWYRVYNNKAQSFLTYVPGLKQEYHKQDNIIKLQPWIEELSHKEHIAIFTESFGIKKGPMLQQALEEEKAIAEKEGQTFKQTDEWRKKMAGMDIPALIEAMKKNLYRETFNDYTAELNHITGRKYMERSSVLSERIEITEELEQWCRRNEGKSKPQWFADLLLNGRTEKARSEAINELQRIADETTVLYLVQYLNSKSNSDQLYNIVFNLLAKFGDDSIITHIKKKLYHEDIYTRREAALVLNKLGDQSGVPIMIESLKSRFKNNRSVANAVLKEITTQDFTENKSLRQLSPDEEKVVIKKWTTWWEQNKAAIKADKVIDFSDVLKGEAAFREQCYAVARETEKNNPDLPTFDNPQKTPLVTFENFKAALMAGDDEKALSYMAPHIVETYREIFPKLGPHRRDYVEGMGNIYFDMELSNVLYYEMTTEQDDGIFSFPIHFAQDLDGNWIISVL